jgi:gas vesicle protein
MLGLGMIIGAAIGAGIALLAAPRSGEETRDRIRDRVRHVRGDYTLWEKLGRELKRAQSLRRKRELLRRRQEEEQLAEKLRAERDARVTPG